MNLELNEKERKWIEEEVGCFFSSYHNDLDFECKFPCFKKTHYDRKKRKEMELIIKLLRKLKSKIHGT